MNVQRFEDAQTFYTEARGFLQRFETENNLLFGILGTLVSRPTYYQEAPYFALVKAGEKVLAAALRTPPHALVLARSDDLRAVRLLVKQADENLPGVSGPEAEAKAFAEAWQASTGRAYTLSMPQRIYRLERVTPVSTAPGTLRQTKASDRLLLTEWLEAFNRESKSSGPPQNAARIVDSYLTSPNRALYVWENEGGPVSMVGKSGHTPTGVRIGAVYTPPEQRNQGYASASVAALSEQLLERHSFCCLYTDLRNPTSNHIYRAMGYKAVCDVNAYTFS